MILPTKRSLALLVVVAPLALLGYASAAAIDLMVVANVVILVLTALDAGLAVSPGRVRVERRAPESFSVGRHTVAAYHWHNGGAHKARLTVREVRPDLLGGAGEPRSFAIAARDSWQESVPVAPRWRGRERGGWLAVRSAGPLGLGLRQWRINLPWDVIVYPSLPASRLKASIAEAVRRREVGLRQFRRLGEGRQFESLREWVPGDDTRHIDWKATARRRKVIARQYEEERRQQVLMVLDSGRLSTEEVAGAARMDYVVRAALWLAFAANHHDDNVGVMVFSDVVQQYVAPQRGRRGLRQVLNVLAVVRPKLVEPDYPAAFRYLAVRNRKRALTVFFTDVIDRLASEALVGNMASLSPRHLPLVVTLRNTELDGVAAGRPTDVQEAYRKAAAEEMLAKREEALAQMRRTGALVLDVPPERASQGVVDAYLALKRRGRL
ncbi:MAG: DUF58 domain-containing protein [Gemmatimonadales bacterium]